MILLLLLILLCSFLYVYSTYRNVKVKIEEFKTGCNVFIPGSGIPLCISLKDREFDMETIPSIFFLSLFLHEDRQFIRHKGFNWPEIFRGAKGTILGRRVRGGSSISQQTAKNLFTKGGVYLFRKGGGALRRKLDETIATVALERSLSKEDILYLYLAACMKLKYPSYGIMKICHYLRVESISNIQTHEFEVIFTLLPSPTTSIEKCKKMGMGAYDHNVSYDNILLLKRALTKDIIASDTLGFSANRLSLDMLLNSPELSIESPLPDLAEEKNVICQTIVELNKIQTILNRIILSQNPEYLAENFLPKWQMAYLHLLKEGQDENKFLSTLNEQHEKSIIKLAIRNKVLGILSAEKAGLHNLLNLKSEIEAERNKIQSFNLTASTQLTQILANLSETSKPFLVNKDLLTISSSHPEHNKRMFDRLYILVDLCDLNIFKSSISKFCGAVKNKTRKSFKGSPLKILTYSINGLEINLCGLSVGGFLPTLIDSIKIETTLDDTVLKYKILSPKDSFLLSTSIKPILSYSSLLEVLELIDLGQHISNKEIEEACKDLNAIRTNSTIIVKLLDTFLFKSDLSPSIKGHVELISLNWRTNIGNLIERIFPL